MFFARAREPTLVRGARAEWLALAKTTRRKVSGWDLFQRTWMDSFLDVVSIALLLETTTTMLLLDDGSGVLLLEGEG